MSFLNDNFIADFLVVLLKLIFGLIKEYSVTVMLVALFVRLALLPFDLKQRRSARLMASIAPEVEGIKKRYANNPNQVNAKIQQLYKEHGISTLAGCLPLLIQLPLLLAFFGALKSIATQETISLFLRAAENGSDTIRLTRWLWVNNLWQPDSGMAGVLPTTSEFLSFLQSNANIIKPQTMQLLQTKGLILFNNGVLSVNEAAYTILKDNIITANGLTGYTNGWFGLPVIAAGTMFLQQWISSRRNKTPNQDQMKYMKYVYPILSLLFCTTSNAMFAIYWAFTNIYSMGTDILYNYFYEKKQAKQKLQI